MRFHLSQTRYSGGQYFLLESQVSSSRRSSCVDETAFIFTFIYSITALGLMINGGFFFFLFIFIDLGDSGSLSSSALNMHLRLIVCIGIEYKCEVLIFVFHFQVLTRMLYYAFCSLSSRYVRLLQNAIVIMFHAQV